MNIKILLCVCASSIIQAQTFSQTPVDSLTTVLEQLAQNNSVKGFGVAVFSKEAVLYKNGFGYADAETKTPYKTQTVQKIASISKLLLGVSLMKAQEMQLLQLDDPVNNYLPFEFSNPKYPNEAITIRQLANHTSGLKKMFKYDLKALYFPTPMPKITDELPFGLRKIVLNKLSNKINTNENLSFPVFLEKLLHKKGEWYHKNHFHKGKPGEKEVYSNAGASLLALIIENASSMPYTQFVQKYILDPLQMKNSGFDFMIKNNLSTQKSSLYHAGIKVPNDYKLILYPAGGFETTIDDFSSFMLAMVRGYNDTETLLSTASFAEMLTVKNTDHHTHGVLWEVYPSTTIGHQGDIAGVMTYAYYNKKLNRGYLLFCNTATTKTIYKDTDKIIETLKSFYNTLTP